MQIKRGESDREAGLSLNAKDFSYNREGNREEFIRQADEVVRARMGRDSITLPKRRASGSGWCEETVRADETQCSGRATSGSNQTKAAVNL